MFVVTGRKEDVAAAKREILSAAEHFSQIRASRRNNNSSGASSGLPCPPALSVPGQVTIQVRVPYRVVGLVVGPKGATIKRIQQQTHTYIVTPNRDREPIFEVTGLPENVEKAKQEIESHIALRTGGVLDGNMPGLNGMPPSCGNLNNVEESNDFHSNGIDAGFHEISNDVLCSMYKPPSSQSAFTSYSTALNQSNNLLSQHALKQDNGMFAFPPLNGLSKMSEFNSPSAAPATAALNAGLSTPNLGPYDSDEGIGGSPTLSLASRSIWADLSCESESHTFGSVFPSASSSATFPRRHHSSVTKRLSPPLSSSSGSSEHSGCAVVTTNPTDQPPAHVLVLGEAADTPAVSSTSFTPLTPGTSMSISSSSSSSSPTDSVGSLGRRRHCLLCSDSDIVAALVPCGHNLFCMDCAKVILARPESQRHCPVCQQTPTQAIRIFS